ncbi:MAG: UDP-N-acetylmuramoyl-tripeptide--D-alanyl-D-alanine ligase [Rhodobacteraceae bacterium]|nr:UDP-N-acetylmuramoyl-tripeptide--D-alanyl-D-alanine ligase [Paracoccaceae bacterium]
MSAPLWTADAAAAAVSGRLEGARGWAAGGVSLDSRSLGRGDLFVALEAARDGHEFVASALSRGAAAALVSRRPEGVAEDAPLLVVPDTLAGLGALGRAGRVRAQARVIGITGSVGKTSVKEMLAHVLAGQASVHASAASHNNHWGVPLTLARLPVGAEFAVVEMGMNARGEIAPLAALVRPHVALVTTIAPAHLEALGSIEAIAEEKGDIYAGLVPGGVALVPGDLPTTPILLAAAERAGARVVRFGAAPGCDWRLEEVHARHDGLSLRAATPVGPLLFKLGAPGAHFARGALATLAAVHEAGGDAVRAALDLARWAPPEGRGARHRILLDPVDDLWIDLIDDAFNANPASMLAALTMLAAHPLGSGGVAPGRGRRVAILGDMLELGPDEATLHAALARDPAMSGLQVVHCVGPRMAHLHAALPPRIRGEAHPSVEDILPRLRHLLHAGDVVLVKGSKGSRVARAVDAIRNLGQAAEPEAQDAR